MFVVDAIQAIGRVPIDVQAMNIDVLATGGQKSILGLPGVGFMVVRAAYIRLSTHCYNVAEEIDHFIAAFLAQNGDIAR